MKSKQKWSYRKGLSIAASLAISALMFFSAINVSTSRAYGYAEQPNLQGENPPSGSTQAKARAGQIQFPIVSAASTGSVLYSITVQQLD